MLKVLDLFSGIGGFSIGLERTGGFETVAFCEIEPFCQKVLRKHWPKVPIYEDVRNVTAEQLRADGIVPDVITGGFPCQDISVAGKQAGITGERSGLWSELARIISEVQPRYAILENVTALISGDRGRWFGRVLGDLAEIGYDAEWHCIPASALGAQHHRDRVWIIAYPDSAGGWDGPKDARKHKKRDDTSDARQDGCVQSLANTSGQGQQRGERVRENAGKTAGGRQSPLMSTAQCGAAIGRSADIWQAEPSVGRVANGIPDRAHRLKGLGNAVVPQIPELIGRAILENC